MSTTLTGQTALVTGASRGIGRAIARRLARDGALVAVHYGQSRAAADELVQAIETEGGQAFALGADVRSVAAIKALFTALDAELTRRTGSAGLDILVNNAGVGAGLGRIEDTTEAQFDLLFDTNFKGMFFVSQQAMPRLRDGGRVVNVGSLSARGAQSMLTAYACSKAPINNLTLAMAQALAPRQIAVNAVLPGLVETDLTGHLTSNPELLAQLQKAVGFGRVGQPDDIAHTVAWLVSPQNTWVSGELIAATGAARL